jgi:hypothetical protein
LEVFERKTTKEVGSLYFQEATLFENYNLVFGIQLSLYGDI